MMPREVRELPRIPERPREAHKGHFGRILIVAGSPGLTGAAALAASAAMRSGAGLVTVACPRSLNGILEVKLTEAMTLPCPETPAGTLALAAKETLLDFAKTCDAFVVGPGLSRHLETASLVRELVRDLPGPTVLDADGLNAFIEHIEQLQDDHGRGLVLTPHPGEMARLTDQAVAEVQEARQQTAAFLASEADCVVLLKGYQTVVTDGQRLYLNHTGNPGMASGGAGDVLSGVLGALLALGVCTKLYDVFGWTCLGAHLHGLAGDIAAAQKGETGMIASDMVEALPEAFLAQASALSPP